VHGILPHNPERKRISFFTVVWLFVLAGGSFAAQCDPGHVDLRWQGGKARFAVEVADDFEERARGLMFRENMARFSGMLFVYPAPAKVAFWMKNTLIPLDMVFLDETGTVVSIHEQAVPGDLTPIPGGDNILAVLEVNGGLVRKLGIPLGARMRHPAFSAEKAVWPCQ
jgi:uncharacterized membrane protein (UPF0127 family)